MAKSLPKSLKIQSNQRTSIRRKVKLERPKKLQQQSSCKMEAKKVKTIMEQLEKSDENVHRSRNNINHFAQLYESYNDKGNLHRTKQKSPRIVLS